MATRVSVEHVDDIPDAAQKDVIEVYEWGIGELFLETEELEVEGNFEPAEFPDELKFGVKYTRSEESAANPGVFFGGADYPWAHVVLALQETWVDDEGKSVALYAVTLE